MTEWQSLDPKIRPPVKKRLINEKKFLLWLRKVFALGLVLKVCMSLGCLVLKVASLILRSYNPSDKHFEIYSVVSEELRERESDNDS